MRELTYAKVGGPPHDWMKLQVRDLDTGQMMADVIEVNTVEGWAIVARYDQRQPLEDVVPTERLTGRFALEWNP